MTPLNGLRETSNAVRGWMWWVVTVLGGLVLCGLAVPALARRQGGILTPSPLIEKTPLLLASDSLRLHERAVIILQPTPERGDDASYAIGQPIADKEFALTLKKKSARRRMRGKKKSRGPNAVTHDDGHEDEDDDDDKREASSSSPRGIARKGEKPLPELPRELSLTGLAEEDEKERLSISDVVIGQSLTRKWSLT